MLKVTSATNTPHPSTLVQTFPVTVSAILPFTQENASTLTFGLMVQRLTVLLFPNQEPIGLKRLTSLEIHPAILSKLFLEPNTPPPNSTALVNLSIGKQDLGSTTITYGRMVQLQIV